MRAQTRLIVPPTMQVSVTLDMTVQEMDALLAITKDENRWPMWDLRKVLRESLGKARDAYSSDWTDPPAPKEG